jgi:predicted NBD/HSP70 family sugar kinase
MTDFPSLTRNQRALLDLIRRHQPILRSTLTDLTDLTQQSVHRLVGQIVDLGLLQVEQAAPSGRGKPSPRVSVNSDAANALGLLVNTDGAVLCLVDLSCRLVAERRVSMDMSSRAEALPRIRAEADRLIAEVGIDRGRLCGLGFTMPGYFAAPRCFNAPEPLRDWSLVDLTGELQALFGLDVLLENSATAGAIGEALNGVGREVASFAYLAFDYGFGGGIVIDGTAMTGHNGNAGEFSTVFTGPGEDADRPALHPLVRTLRAHGVAVAGVEDLRHRFDPDWPGVADWIDRIMPQLDRIVIGLQGILDPEAIVFGGQIPPALAEMLIARVRCPRRARYDAGLPRPRLLPSRAEGDPAATGAALKALKAQFFL